MLYNCKGDLYKIEIVRRLKNMGFDVNRVNALNKIMEKWGYILGLVLQQLKHHYLRL